MRHLLGRDAGGTPTSVSTLLPRVGDGVGRRQRWSPGMRGGAETCVKCVVWFSLRVSSAR